MSHSEKKNKHKEYQHSHKIRKINFGYKHQSRGRVGRAAGKAFLDNLDFRSLTCSVGDGEARGSKREVRKEERDKEREDDWEGQENE